MKIIPLNFIFISMLLFSFPGTAEKNIDSDTQAIILGNYTNKQLIRITASFRQFYDGNHHKPAIEGKFNAINSSPAFSIAISKKTIKGNLLSISLFAQRKNTKNVKFVVKQIFGESYGHNRLYDTVMLRGIPVGFKNCTNNILYAVFETEKVLLWDSVEVHVPGCREFE